MASELKEQTAAALAQHYRGIWESLVNAQIFAFIDRFGPEARQLAEKVYYEHGLANGKKAIARYRPEKRDLRTACELLNKWTIGGLPQEKTVKADGFCHAVNPNIDHYKVSRISAGASICEEVWDLPVEAADFTPLPATVAPAVDYAKVFPLIYRLIGQEVESRLWKEFPAIHARVGADTKAETMAYLPSLGENVPLDWVAFNLPGRDFWEVHVGCVLNYAAYPPRAHVGVHFVDRLWPEVKERVMTFDWQKATGHPLNVEYAWGESRPCDVTRDLDTSNLAAEARRLVDRVVAYYQAGAAILQS